MKAYTDGRRTAPLILTLGTSGGERSTSWPGRFTAWGEPRYERLGGPQSRLRQFWKRENLLHLPGFELRTVQPIGSRYPGSYPLISWRVIVLLTMNLIHEVRKFRTVSHYLTQHIKNQFLCCCYKILFTVSKFRATSYMNFKFYRSTYLKETLAHYQFPINNHSQYNLRSWFMATRYPNEYAS